MKILQRITDWLRERRIAALAHKAAATHARTDWNALTAEIHARSPQQVERMERARGIR
jgi:hypothetical protein